MKLVVRSILIADLEDVYRQGARHPQLGLFLDGGSHCPILGVPAGEKGLTTVVEAALSARTEHSSHGKGSLPNREGESTDTLTVASGIVDLRTGLGEPSNMEFPGDGEALCLIVADGTHRLAPLLIFYGSTLPTLGSIPPCNLEDLQTTWARLTSGKIVQGRFLLEQSPPQWDAGLDEKLTERLRELYGE